MGNDLGKPECLRQLDGLIEEHCARIREAGEVAGHDAAQLTAAFADTVGKLAMQFEHARDGLSALKEEVAARQRADQEIRKYAASLKEALKERRAMAQNRKVHIGRLREKVKEQGDKLKAARERIAELESAFAARTGALPSNQAGRAGEKKRAEESRTTGHAGGGDSP
jgi:chromosome segregation ATPase